MAKAWAYFDTSVLVKRYIREQASSQAMDLLGRHLVLTSAIAPVETLSAISRRREAGDLAKKDYDSILACLRADRIHWELVEVGPTILEEAETLVQSSRLRTLDAIHVASAVVVRGFLGARLPFVTADREQRDAAEAAGMEVVWVG